MSTIIASRSRFHVIVLAVLAATVFVGFARTYYVKFLFDSPPLEQAAHLHGLLATLWIALHYTQARLIAGQRVDLHRRLGIAAAAVALVLALQTTSFAIGSAAAGHAPPTRDPLRFLAASLGNVTMFSLFVASALLLRRHREWHKRFMLFATFVMLNPAIGRLDSQIMQPLGFPRVILPIVVTLAFMAWAVAHDWRRSRRVHPAYVVGTIAMLGSFPLRGFIGSTDAWLSIARWLVATHRSLLG
jgi:hypothetical protein